MYLIFSTQKAQTLRFGRRGLPPCPCSLLSDIDVQLLLDFPQKGMSSGSTSRTPCCWSSGGGSSSWLAAARLAGAVAGGGSSSWLAAAWLAAAWLAAAAPRLSRNSKSLTMTSVLRRFWPSWPSHE